MINIFLFQCIILFTSYNINPNIQFIDNRNNEYLLYKYIIYNEWKNYTFIKNTLENKEISENFYYLYNSEKFTFLIIIIDYFKIGTIVDLFLDNIVNCGFSYNIVLTDGYLMTPFEFVGHDIIHGNNYNFSCTRFNTPISEVKIFYNLFIYY